MNFILCADLHLKETEKAYSFSVLEEITGLAEQHKCGALFFSGDVFDSRDAVEKLRADFRAAVEKLPPSCAVYFLPGNHEELNAKDSSGLEKFDFGRVKLLAEKPCKLYPLDETTELLAVPFQRDISGYHQWNIPPKQKPLRILLAHGTVPGMIYTGPGEDDDSVLDEDLFTKCHADIAALGHIHRHIIAKRGSLTIAYPGSAQVWREGETGKRLVLLGSTQTPARFEPLYLDRAGEFRVIPVYADPAGKLNESLPENSSPHDWLHLELTGVVDEEPPVLLALEKLEENLKKKYRKVSSNKDKLAVLSGISAHPLAKRFLRAWKETASGYADAEPSVYERARVQGLLALKTELEKLK